MPIFKTAPSPAQFAEAWSKELSTAVKSVAGTDGRLSLSELKKLPSDNFVADNLKNIFDSSGQKSMSVSKLEAQAHAYALRAAQVAAGADGKLSLADAAKLPADLKTDFLFMRGKVTAVPAPAVKLDGAALEAAILEKAQGLVVTSEGDANVVPLNGGQIGHAPITPALVRELLSTQHDAKFDSVMWSDAATKPLSTRVNVEERDFTKWFADHTRVFDAGDTVSVDLAKKLGAMGDLLKGQLTDLKVFRFGEINISVFIVGRTANGELAGVLTGAVET